MLPAGRHSVRLLQIAFVIGALAALSIALRAPGLVVDKPFSEDGFYLLSVARNLALGNGPSVDGQTPTNGFQPLFAALSALAYLPVDGDRITGLRLVSLLHGAIFVLAALLFGRIVRGDRGDPERMWVGALVYLSAGFLFMQHHNGLETGLVLLGYLACWRLHQVLPPRGPRAAALHGALLGLLVLARIDAAFLVVALCAFCARVRPRDAVVMALCAALVSSPWWLYNWFEFGALMPTSGTAQMQSLDGGSFARDHAMRLQTAAEALLLVATPSLYMAGGLGGAAVVALRIVLLVLVIWAVGRPRIRHAFLPALLLAAAAWAIYYVGFSWAAHFYGRYFAPLALLGAAGAAALAMRVLRLGPWTRLPIAIAGAAHLLVLAYACHAGRGFSGNEWYREQFVLVQERVPESATVAAGQTGTLGYFRDRVVNLDGKVNPEALRHRDDIGRYLDQRRIDWVCDWDVYVTRYLGADPTLAGWQLVARRGEFGLWHRDR